VCSAEYSTGLSNLAEPVAFDRQTSIDAELSVGFITHNQAVDAA
jgi:hypothetical protein